MIVFFILGLYGDRYWCRNLKYLKNYIVLIIVNNLFEKFIILFFFFKDIERINKEIKLDWFNKTI